jgi:glycosyltransferase involved in cell wall biosynthesis
MVAEAARVCVVVPVRDRRVLLPRTLDALARQSFPAFEVVVVDDGSTDGSGDLAAERGRTDARFRLVRTHGIGAVAARTLGVRDSQAPYLAFTDSDCVPADDWLERGVSHLDAGAALVQGLTRPERPPRPLERSVWVDFEDGLYATCNIFYRRDVFEAAGGFDPALGSRLGFRPDSASRGLGIGEDTLLGWRVRRTHGSRFAPDTVVRHHVFPADAAEVLRRAWSVGAFPGLVREVPELRQTLLVDGLWLGGRWRAPLYAAVLAAAVGRAPLSMAGVAVWAVARGRRNRRVEPDLRRFVKTLPVDLCCDAVAAAALAAGSVRARRPVL